MDNWLNYLRCCILLGLSGCCLSMASGQETMLSFDQAPLPKVIQALEQHTGLIFNFDAQLLAEYQYSGSIALDHSDVIDQILYHTPLAYQKSQKTVLVYLPAPSIHKRCGRIVDRASGAALPFANIALLNSSQGTLADEEGYFEFQFKGYRNQLISISYLGYQSESWMIQEIDSSDCSSFQLEIDFNLMTSEIIVSDYLLTGITEGGSYGEHHLDYSQLTQQHSLVEQDILKTVQLLPGINSIDESAGNIQIRGGSADQQLILWEGAPLYGGGHFFGMISSINPFVVDQVKVQKGVIEPAYDHRVGGVIDVSLNDSLARQWHGGFGSTLSEAHAHLQLPILPERLSIIASGRKTIYDLYESPTLVRYSEKVFQDTRVDDESDNPDSEQVIDFYDWNTKVLFRPSESLLFKASWLKSRNDFNFSTLLIDEIDLTDIVLSNAEAMSASLEASIHPKWTSKLNFSRSLYQNSTSFELFNFIDDEIVTSHQIYNDITDHQLSFRNDIQWSKAWSMQLGYVYNQKTVNYNFTVESEFEEDWEDFNGAEGHFHNIFGGFQYQKKDFLINLGWRTNYYQEADTWALSPRLSLQYAINEQIKLKGSAGILQQYISQLTGFGDDEIANNNQVWVLHEAETEQVQQAQKISAGLVYQHKGWLVDIEAYYNKVDGLSSLSPAFTGQDALTDFSLGYSVNRGIDFLIKKRWKRFNSWLSYSLNKGNYTFPNLSEETFPATNDQRHNLSLVNNWQHKQWTFSLIYQFRTGLPFSQPTELFRETDPKTNETYYEIIHEDLNRERLAHYSRLDLGVRFMPQFKKSRIKTEFSFQLINLLNRDNLLSRHHYIEELDGDDDSPEIYPYTKILLQRTPQLLLRMYW